MNEMAALLATAKPVVLLVDDSDDILDYLEHDFDGKYQTLTARDGLAAIATMQKKEIQLVVSDVMMPRMDGFELCERIKSSPGLSHIPVILLTAKNTYQSKIEGLKLGADAYIEKPFSLDHLHVQMENLLENRLKLKESFARSPLALITSAGYSKEDELFWKQLTTTILDNLLDTELDVEKIALMMHMSKATLYRKMKATSGMSPSDVINITRLKRSAELMNAGNFRIHEVAREVGYQYPAQFRRNFQKQFHMSPAEYIEKVRSVARGR